jgi:2-polyprenyl-3-methyl-5-hydroxy-6-metoxy-1,4-benzoquinol methylase
MNECIVCNSTDSSSLYQEILQCKVCNHVYANVQISEEGLRSIYSKDYFEGTEYSNYLADKEALYKNFQMRLKQLRNYMDPARHRHLLEIGSAFGLFLEIAQNDFETVMGVDISEDATRYVNEQLHLTAINQEFLQYNFVDRTFDVVCLWDTIEHLISPERYLQKISSLTKAGAILALTTGDISSLNARMRKGKWRLIHPPTHVHYFSRATLKKLLENSGFQIVYSRYCGFYRSLNNVLYNILVLKKGGRKVYNVLQKTKLTNLRFYSNLYDILYVIGRRI